MPLAPLFPSPPAPGNDNPRLVVEVDGDVIDERFGVQWQDVLSQIGSGEFTLLNDHHAIATLAEGQVVIFSLDGDEFIAWVIDNVHRTSVSEEEDAQEVTVFSGSTTLAELRKAVVMPAGGVVYVETPIYVGTISLKPYSGERFFGPMEVGYDVTGWDDAEAVPLAAPDLVPYVSALWIGSTDDVIHIRDTFTTTGIYKAKLFFAASTAAHVFIDGTCVARPDDTEIESSDPFKERAVEFEVRDGTHTIYARVAKGTFSYSAIIFSIWAIDSDDLLLESSEDAKMTAATAGVTPGYVADKVLTEMQDRDVNALWDWDFTITHDTAGRKWPRIGDWWSCRVKDLVLSVLEKLCEGWAEMHALASNGGRTLSMWVAEGVTDGDAGTGTGYVPTVGVTIERGVNATTIIHERSAVAGNAVAWEFNDGLFYAGPDPVPDDGVVEIGLDLSELDGAQSIFVAEANLRPIAEKELSITVEFEPPAGDEADQVAIVKGLGGVCTTEAWDGTPTGYRIRGHSGGEDNNGNIKVRPELNTARDTMEQRYQRFLSRTNNGTNDGRSASATISSRDVIDSTVISPLGGLSFSTGGAYSIIGDRGSRRRYSEPALVLGAVGECDVAGADGDTDYAIEIDGSVVGTITFANGDDDAEVRFATPIYADQTNISNIECTAEGGHVGCSIDLIAVPIT